MKKEILLDTLKLKITSMFIILMAASCLPLQKKTQCADNEAFNATRRKCVPVVGASSSSTVFITSKTPVNSYTTKINDPATTHMFSVSDVYEYGYSTKWFLHFNRGATSINNVFLASNSLSYVFNPNAHYGIGNYILEGRVFDTSGANLLDSVSWNITVGDFTSASLTNPSPAGTSFSYANNVTTATHQVDVTNPDLRTGTFNWFLDGTNVATGSYTAATTNLSHTINPSTLSLGLHTLEVEIKNATGTVVSNHLWTLNIVNPDLPQITTTAPDHLYSISAVDGIAFGAGGYRFFNGTTFTALTQICVTVDNFDKDGNTVSDIDIQFDINGSVEHAGTFSSNVYCHNTFSTQTLGNPDIGESKTLTARLFKAGTNTLVDFKQWNLSIRQKNIRPSIRIRDTAANGTDPTINCNSTGSNVYWTNCQLTQSVDFDNNSDYTNDAKDVDNRKQFGVEITYDPDIVNNNNYEVIYKLKKSTDATTNNLGGANAYSAVDCEKGLADNPDTLAINGHIKSSAKMTCNLSMDAFRTNGPVEPGNYILTAFVRDSGSVFDPGNQKDSNIVTWEIVVTEDNTSPVVVQAQANGGATANRSWIEAVTSGNTCSDGGNGTELHTGGGANGVENDFIIAHIAVEDAQRDNLKVQLELENNLNGGHSIVSPLIVHTKTDNTAITTVDICFKLPEWAVSGVATDNIELRALVSDAPNVVAATNHTPVPVLTFNVNNHNPRPTFTGYTIPGSLDQNLNATVVAGYPFTINTPAPTDASIYDGKNIKYQWQISLDNGGSWNNITNADDTKMSNTTLVWTPDLDGNSGTADWPAGQTRLRICLGDDGFGNATDCANPESTIVYSNITVRRSVLPLTSTAANFSSGDNLASWYDSVDNILITGYTSGNNIHLEKFKFDTKGAPQFVSRLSFAAESPTKVATNAHNLSITGFNDGADNEAIYVTYRVNDVATSTPQMRIRRIYKLDTASINLMSFHYGGLYDASNTAGDLYSTTVGGATLTVAESGTDSMSLTFASNAGLAGQSVTLNGVNFPYDAGPGTWCNGGGCPDAASVASSLASVINASTNDDIRRTMRARYVAASNTLTIDGFPRDDFRDDSKSTPSIGEAVINSGSNELYLPYTDSFTSLKLGVWKITSVPNNLSGAIPTHGAVAASATFLQEMSNDLNSTNELVVAAKNSAGNVNVYKINTGTYAVTAVSNNIFGISASPAVLEVTDVDLSVGGADFVWVAGKSSAPSTVEKSFLSAAILNPALSDVRSDILLGNVTGEDRFKAIDDIQISANPDALTGNISHAIVSASYASWNPSIANQVQLLKLSLDTGTFGTSNIQFNSNAGPKLNQSNTVDNTKIHSAGIFTPASTNPLHVTKGDAKDTANENRKDTMFLFWHELNGGNVIKHSTLNVHPESITTDSIAVEGSYPANLSN